MKPLSRCLLVALAACQNPPPVSGDGVIQCTVANNYCRPDSGPSLDGGLDGGDGGATMTVTVTQLLRHVTDLTEVDVPANFSNDILNVLVPDPTADSGYDIYPAVASDAGIVSAFTVPSSVTSYYFEYGLRGDLYVEGLSPTLDLDDYVVGRPNAAIADAGITYELSGLTPWVPGDVLALACAGANANRLIGGPLVGRTTLAATVNYSEINLIDSTQGDIAVVYQLIEQQDGGAAVIQGSSNGYQTSSFTMVGGGTATLDAGLQPLAPHSVNWIFDQAGFDNLAPQVSPNAQSGSTQTFGVAVTPGGGTHGIVSDSVGNVVLENLFTASQTDPGAEWSASGTYGNPFPPSWGAYGYANEHVTVPENVRLPDGGIYVDSEVLEVGFSVAVANMPAPGGRLSPMVGPPASLMADGQDITARGGTLRSTQPLLSWSSPDVGAPLLYHLQIEHLSFDVNGAMTRVIYSVMTRETNLRVFPDVMLPGGNQYLIIVSSISRPNGSLLHPLLGSFPQATAPVISGVVTTP
jgi:hypothetical protein